MKAFLITITLVALVVLTPAQDSVTVPCTPAHCEELTLFNRIIELRNAEDEDLKRLEESLIHNPPGLVVDINRSANLEALIKKSEAVEALYKAAGSEAHQRTMAYRAMLAIERK